MNTSIHYIAGGGEMGALIRACNWESSLVGPIENWPQSLLITLGILLHSKFPMFLFWGPHHICFYNDAYRTSLRNDGTEPEILGQKGEEAWPGVWENIKTQIDQVLSGGDASWNENQLIPLFRNGQMEDSYWTLSYSSVKGASVLPVGVFVTCTETTEKVKNLKKLEESNQMLNFAIDATKLGTWDYNPITNKFNGNNRFKDWLGLPYDIEVGFLEAIDLIVEEDRNRVSQAFRAALKYESGGLYDIEYTMFNAITKEQRIVHAKGNAWFGDDNKAYRVNGTLQDITASKKAEEKLKLSEAFLFNERQVLYHSFMNAPAGIAILKGETHIYEFANKNYEKYVGKKIILGKSLKELFPEIEQQGIIAIVDHVFMTGEPFIGNEIPVELNTKGDGILEKFFLNLVVQPLKNEDGYVERILAHIIDVTEEVETRSKIEASEEKYRSLFDSIDQGISIVELVFDEDNKPIDYRFIENNAIFQQQTALPDLTNKTARESIPSLEDFWYETYGNVVLTGKPIKFKHKAEALNSWFDVYAFKLGNKDSKKVAILFTNITERKLAEEKIKNSEEKIRNFILQAPVAMCLYRSPEYTIEIVNEEMLKIWDKSLDSVFNKPIFEALPEIKGQGFEALFLKVFTTGEKYSAFGIPIKLLRNGLPRTIYVNVVYQACREDDGVISGIVEVVTDVTEQVLAAQKIEKSEAFNRTILESSPDCLKVLDIKGRIQYMNFNGLCQMEIDDFSTIKGCNWCTLWGSENDSLVKGAIDKALTGETVQFTAFCETAKGTPKWWDVMVSPVGKPGRPVEQIISVARDITLAREEANSFNFTISHDLRTPLTSIKSYAELLLLTNETLDEGGKNMLERINASADKMAMLIKHILNYSTYANADLKIERINVKQLVQGIKTEIFESQQPKNLAIIIGAMPDIFADNVMIGQVFANLLGNAVKYSSKHSKPVVKVEGYVSENETIFKIEDNGIGIDAKYHSKVFELFKRMDNVKDYEGSGAGLAIVKRIMDKHKGKIWFDSEIGKGTIFYISFKNDLLG